MTPKPYLFPFLQAPLYLLPFGHVYSPSPSFSLSFHYPLQISPLSLCITAKPQSLLLQKWPSKIHPFCMNTPFPCFLLFRNQPLYRASSLQMASPFPLGKLCFHCPSQRYPETSIYLPQPSATLFLKSPSQQLPSFLINLPCPQQLPFTNSPSKQSPLSNQREPTPLGVFPVKSPEQYALIFSIQTFFKGPWLLILPITGKEGKCCNLDLTFCDKLDQILLRLLLRKSILELSTLLLKNDCYLIILLGGYYIILTGLYDSFRQESYNRPPYYSKQSAPYITTSLSSFFFELIAAISALQGI